MEIRASYMLVGAVVLALITGLAAFSVWLVKADVDGLSTTYEIYFEGSVTGLQEGSQVRYRGIPVGQIVDIGFDPENVEQVRTIVEIDQNTPIKQDTIATLEMQGITGTAYVQLKGGTQGSPPLVTGGNEGDVPVITAERSALEQVFDKTPDLLAEAIQVADRVSKLLNDDNVETLSATLDNLKVFSDGLAANADGFGKLTSDATETLAEFKATSANLSQLSNDLRDFAGKLNQGIEGVGSDLLGTLNELSGAASALGGAAKQLDGMVDDLREPLSDFSGTGLYELTNLVGESRALVAALNRITKEVERDPGGFLFGGNKQGFEAE